MGQKVRKSFLIRNPKSIFQVHGPWTTNLQELLENKFVLYTTQTPGLHILLCQLGGLKCYLLSTLLHNKDTD